MRSKFKALGALAVAAALALTGCTSGGGSSTPAPTSSGDSGGSGSDQFRVVAFTSGNQTPVGAWWVRAVERKAQELGWDLTMVQGDFDFQKMNPAVESAIGQGTDIVFDGYTDYASIGSIVTAAKDAGVPMFAVDSGTEPSDAFAINITVNQEVLVDQTLGALADALGGSLEGKTIMVLGHDPHAGIRKRASIAEQKLKEMGANVADGEIKKIESPATGRTEALKFVADYLAAHPGGLDGVWAGWDDAALGAAKAIEEAGATAYVTGVDAIAESVASILNGGALIATAMQPWPEILDMVIADIEAYRETGTLPSSNYGEIDPVLVDKSNAADITPSDQLD